MEVNSLREEETELIKDSYEMSCSQCTPVTMDQPDAILRRFWGLKSGPRSGRDGPLR
jgi:hypothetical protein